MNTPDPLHDDCDDDTHECADGRHYFDIDKDGNIAIVCRCGHKRRSQMQ